MARCRKGSPSARAPTRAHQVRATAGGEGARKGRAMHDGVFGELETEEDAATDG